MVPPKLSLLLTFSVFLSGCSSFQSVISSPPSAAPENNESVTQQSTPPNQTTNKSNTESDTTKPGNTEIGTTEPTTTVASETPTMQPKSPNLSKPKKSGKPRVTRSAEQAASNVMRPAAAINQTIAVDPQVSVTTKPLETDNAVKISNQTMNTDAPTLAAISQAAPPTEESAITTVEQINQLTEETPTAAGIAATDIALADPEPTTIESIAIASEQTLAAEVEATEPPQIRRPNPNKIFKRKAVGIWTIEKSQEGEYAGVCRVSTPTRQLSQPDYSTQLWLNIINDELIVNTSTKVDINQQGVGVKANNEKLTPFSKSLYPDTVVWSGNLAEILNKSGQLDIVIGGSELGKKTITTSFNMKSLKNAYSAYDDCRY